MKILNTTKWPSYSLHGHEIPPRATVERQSFFLVRNERSVFPDGRVQCMAILRSKIEHSGRTTFDDTIQSFDTLAEARSAAREIMNDKHTCELIIQVDPDGRQTMWPSTVDKLAHRRLQAIPPRNAAGAVFYVAKRSGNYERAGSFSHSSSHDRETWVFNYPTLAAARDAAEDFIGVGEQVDYIVEVDAKGWTKHPLDCREQDANWGSW